MINMEKILGNVDARILTQKNDLIAYVARCEKERQDVLDGAEPHAIKQMRIEMYDQALSQSKARLQDVYKPLADMSAAIDDLYEALEGHEPTPELYQEFSKCGIELVEHYRKQMNAAYLAGEISHTNKIKLESYYEEREQFFTVSAKGQEALDIYIDDQLLRLDQDQKRLLAIQEATLLETEELCKEVQMLLDADENISESTRKALNALLTKCSDQINKN